MMNVFTAIWFDRRVPPRKEIIARLCTSLLGIVTAGLGLAAPQTFAHRMIVEGGPVAIAAAYLMVAVSLALLVETIVNDMLPRRFEFPWGRHKRQFLWMTLGLMFMAFCFQVFTGSLSIVLGTYLVIFGLASLLLAFVDAAAEKMDRRSPFAERRRNDEIERRST